MISPLGSLRELAGDELRQRVIWINRAVMESCSKVGFHGLKFGWEIPGVIFPNIKAGGKIVIKNRSCPVWPMVSTLNYLEQALSIV